MSFASKYRMGKYKTENFEIKIGIREYEPGKYYCMIDIDDSVIVYEQNKEFKSFEEAKAFGESVIKNNFIIKK